MKKKDDATIEFTYVDDDSEDDEELEDEEEEESEEDSVEEEVEMIETVFTEENIDELIGLLEELKETKTSITFGLDETTEVIIHHEEDPELGEDEEE